MLESLFKTSDKVGEYLPISGFNQAEQTVFTRHTLEGHSWVEAGAGQPIIFCHGLFGSFRNFNEIGKLLAERYRIIIPYLPMYDMPLSDSTVNGLSVYLESFINTLDLRDIIATGNSMGGGTVLNYAVRNPNNVSKIILFASSGLSFIPMRGGFLKIKDYEYVRNLLEDIFFEKGHIPEEEFQEVFETIQNKKVLLRCLSFTRSTKKDLLHQDLPKLTHPTLIIWGANDNVTPPTIGQEFYNLIPNSTLHILENCGHVPPLEKPDECYHLINEFLVI